MDRVDRETAIDRLYAVPLDEFVSERKRLAKELRSEGDRESAAEVAKWPKPTAPAWALNQLAREAPDELAPWLEAAEALRDASARAGEVGGDALRAAMAAHRDATRQLVGAVRERRPLSEPMVDRVRALLQSATVDPAAAERLRAGRLAEGDADAPLPEPAESAAPRAERAPAKPPAEDRAVAARAAEEQERAERRAELERRVGAAYEELARLREELAEREAAAETAEARLDEARRTLHRSESEASAAHDAVKDAREAAGDAEREVEELTARLRAS
jgi:hypothetical protein